MVLREPTRNFKAADVGRRQMQKENKVVIKTPPIKLISETLKVCIKIAFKISTVENFLSFWQARNWVLTIRYRNVS